MITAWPAVWATSTAGSDSPWPSSSRLGTYGSAARPNRRSARTMIARPVSPSASKSPKTSTLLTCGPQPVQSFEEPGRVGQQARIVKAGTGRPEVGREARRRVDSPPGQDPDEPVRDALRRSRLEQGRLDLDRRGQVPGKAGLEHRPSVRRSASSGLHHDFTGRPAGRRRDGRARTAVAGHASGGGAAGRTAGRLAPAAAVLPVLPDDEERARVEDRRVGPGDDADQQGKDEVAGSPSRRTGAGRSGSRRRSGWC